VDLTATLDSGPYFTLGDVVATGLKRYPAKIIENMNTIEVGEAYSRSKLLDYQKRLQNLPYFSSVIVDISNDRKDAQLAPIKVQVVELPTQNFKGLVGYGTDAGYRANVQYSHYNVFKKGWIFDSKVDWQYVDREARISLTTPQNKDHYQWSLVNKFNQTRHSSTGSDVDNALVGVHYARKLEHTALSYDLDYYQTHTQNSSADFKSHALFAGVTWAKNSVDNPSFPRKGYAIEASIGGALKGAASTASFLRAYGRFRYFIPFQKEDSLVLRVEAGAVLTHADVRDVPSPLLFLAGGSSSLRGYSYQAIGDTVSSVVYPAKYLATASAEYTHWFNKSWGAAVFYDVGTATNALTNVTVYHGAGVGARWRSPVGPIHFDLAYGYPRKRLAPHISIGILF
jgi:translocation and assembly module TamA